MSYSVKFLSFSWNYLHIYLLETKLFLKLCWHSWRFLVFLIFTFFFLFISFFLNYFFNFAHSLRICFFKYFSLMEFIYNNSNIEFYAFSRNYRQIFCRVWYVCRTPHSQISPIDLDFKLHVRNTFIWISSPIYICLFYKVL